MRRWARHLIALALAVAVSALSLIGLAFLSDVVRPRKAKPVVKAKPIPFAERPKRKRKPRAVKPTKAVAKGGPEMPSLELPSNIQAPELAEGKLDMGSLLRPALAQQKTLAVERELIMTEDLVDDPPRALLSPSARYPAAAQGKGLEGAVSLKVLIDEQGAVEQVIVTSSQPPGVFDQAAADALRRYRFSPASFQGQKVKVWARQRLVFELE